MLAATWLMKVGTTDAARMPWTRIAPISWLTCSSAASSLESVVASMPASPSKNAPVKTREKGVRLRAQRRGWRGGGKRVGIPVEERIHRVAQTIGLDRGRNRLTDGPAELFRQPREP